MPQGEIGKLDFDGLGFQAGAVRGKTLVGQLEEQLLGTAAFPGDPPDSLFPGALSLDAQFAQINHLTLEATPRSTADVLDDIPIVMGLPVFEALVAFQIHRHVLCGIYPRQVNGVGLSPSPF